MQTLTITQSHAIRAVFVLFTTRDGTLTEAQAREELTRLFAADLRVRLRDSYLMMSRVGASFTVNRAQRMRIYDTFANAINHATFDA